MLNVIFLFVFGSSCILSSHLIIVKRFLNLDKLVCKVSLSYLSYEFDSLYHFLSYFIIFYPTAILLNLVEINIWSPFFQVRCALLLLQVLRKSYGCTINWQDLSWHDFHQVWAVLLEC